VSNSSRIGFKGSEDLGEELKVIWQVESLVNLDEGGSQFATRNSFVGLAHGFGSLIFGRNDTPMKVLGRRLDLFDETVGDIRALTALNGVFSPGFDTRLDNVIAYLSPDFAGLKLVTAYSADWQPDTTASNPDNNDFQAFSHSLTYQNGPIFAGLAYEQHDINTNLPGGTQSEQATRVGLGLDVASFKFNGFYQRSTSDFDVRAEGRDVWGLGAQYAFGATSLAAQYYWINEGDLGSDTGANQWAVGVFHNLSKRTRVYGAFAQVDNDDRADFALGGGGGHGDVYGPEISPTNPAGLGGDPNAFSVGIIHSF
jgi:predicted porin